MKIQVETRYCSAREIRQVMSHLQREGAYFIAGASGIYIPKGKRRYVDKAVCKLWPDIEGYTRLHTPGEAVRVELLREWPELKRVGWSGPQVALLDWRSPLHYTGPHVGEMIYIDLDGAYSQIYEKLWLDTAFPRGYYGRYPLWGVAQRLAGWKAARNALIGIARARDAVAYRGERRLRLKTKNKYLSPGLWASTQAILHWIMAKAVDLGAIYGNVDGYIFPLPDWEFVEEFTAWLSDLEIRWSVRATGQGEIVSWNNYNIGGTRTKANKLNLTHKSKEFSNVNTRSAGEWGVYWENLRRITRTNGDNNDAT